MTAPAIEFAQVGFQVGGRDLLREISLSLTPGSTTALLGRSGSGKTTLMRTVNRLVEPTSGQVIVADRATRDWKPLELRRGIGYVIQDTGLFPHWTVERNVGLALEVAGKPNPAKVSEVLDLAGLDATFASRYPRQLSGGQRQRVGLARALAGDPGVLLMDEPFGALDPMTRAEMQDMLLALLQRVKKTVLLVTHDLNEAMYLTDRVIFLEAGEVVADLPAHDVPSSPLKYVQRYLAAVHRGDPAA